MTLDSSNSHFTADEMKGIPCTENLSFPKGTSIPESEIHSGSGIKTCPEVSADLASQILADPCTSWSYIFVHNQKVRAIESTLRNDQLTFFVHKTIRYVPRRGRNNTLREVVSPTVSGLVFLQGSPQKLKAYLDEKIPGYKLCKNCSTGRVATIPCSQMEPFMRIAETDPDRIRFLLRPFVYYAQNRTLLRITTGEYAGLEGYVIRIARDRKLVMDVGGMSIAISGIHAERFEEVDKKPVAPSSAPAFYQRNLHERNAFVDRYFHPVRTPQEVTAQTENIEMLRRQTLSDVLRKKLDMKDALEIFSFIIEEIGYYYAPFLDHFKDNLLPILEAGKKVFQELSHLISTLPATDDSRQRSESAYDELRTNYGYLFE